MASKLLIHTNPYLKEPKIREKLIETSVRTSCGVEGIKPTKRKPNINIPRRKTKRIYRRRAKI